MLHTSELASLLSHKEFVVSRLALVLFGLVLVAAWFAPINAAEEQRGVRRPNPRTTPTRPSVPQRPAPARPVPVQVDRRPAREPLGRSVVPHPIVIDKYGGSGWRTVRAYTPHRGLGFYGPPPIFGTHSYFLGGTTLDRGFVVGYASSFPVYSPYAFGGSGLSTFDSGFGVGYGSSYYTYHPYGHAYYSHSYGYGPYRSGVSGYGVFDGGVGVAYGSSYPLQLEYVGPGKTSPHNGSR